jgi:hypothetical protein
MWEDMMKVHVVMRNFPYEGDEIVAVYAKLAKAKRHAARLQKEDAYLRFYVFTHEVIE